MKAYAQLTAGALLDIIDIEAPALADLEVEIEVLHCGVCHSDLHLLDGDWGEPVRPLVPGHEIVGRVTRVGLKVPPESVTLGMTVGLGWQAGACFLCRECLAGNVHLCSKGKVRTCVGRPGGFAERVLADYRFCFALPEGLNLADAAPLLCAGLTVFSPMRRFVFEPGAQVCIVGLGGLGHLAVQFAHKMGAIVSVVDADASRQALATEFGASHFYPAEAPPPAESFDRVFVTTHAALDWNVWMTALRSEGVLCLIGVPKGAVTVEVDPLLDGQKILTGSVIGSPSTMREMLSFATKHGVSARVSHLPMKEANLALKRLKAGEAKLRIVLDR
jgi:alcohol/geraniol dehydrogenase (NADP+)